MPSKSKSQQKLFGMALAVRKGELDRSEVNQEVLNIVDGDMTTQQIEDFAKVREGLGMIKYQTLKDFLNEQIIYGKKRF